MLYFKSNVPEHYTLGVRVFKREFDTTSVLMVSMVIWQVVLMIFDAPQTIRLFPIEPTVIGPNRGENEFNLTLLLVFIIFFGKLRRNLSENPQ